MAVAVQVLVSDPWDFGEAIDWRPLNGVVRHQEPLTIELDTAVRVGGRSINWIVGTARYGASTLSSAPAAYSFIGVDQLDTDPKNVIAHWRGAAHGTVFIGSVQLA